MLGWQLSDRTVFEGVHVAPAGSVLALRDGRLGVQQFVAALPSEPLSPPSLDDAIDELVVILRSWLDCDALIGPGTLLQLTGGHDSRILLGAIPESRRVGLRALTLGDAGDRDVMIAAQLCRRYGMVHEVHGIDDQPWPEVGEVHDLVMNSARALECMASPLASAPLWLAESRIEQGCRLSGLGGEVARGFYYAGQRRRASTSDRLVARLARWRLLSNEAVEVDALASGLRSAGPDRARRALREAFVGGDWLRSTDEFYLHQRLRRWGGAHATVATEHREAVNVMLDRRFLEISLAVSPRDKRNSLLLGRLMSRLDAGLSVVPLDTGLVPAQLGTRTARTRARVSRCRRGSGRHTRCGSVRRAGDPPKPEQRPRPR